MYVRTTRRRIRTIQEKVADKIREAEGLEDILDEEEIFDKLDTYLQKKDLCQPDDRLRFFQRQARGKLGAKVPAGIDEKMWAELMGESCDEEEESRPKEEPKPKAVDCTVTKGESGEYVVSVTEKRGFRRLHQLGRCYRVPGLHYTQWLSLGTERPSTTEYDDFCRNCWPAPSKGGVRGQSQSMAQDGSSSGSSSSGSSSSSSE